MFDYIQGQTPIDEEEKLGLRIASISTRQELDEFEQYNIEKAIEWTSGRSFKADVILSEDFILKVHQRMFDDVWKWAGEFRLSEKNLGVNHWVIRAELKRLLDDARYWLDHKTFSQDEFALRFKHRIVSIHCFPNGNGRHSRLMADIIVEKIFNLPVFTWGAAGLSKQGSARDAYLKALKTADQGDFSLLLEFARS